MVNYEDWARQILSTAIVTPNTPDDDNAEFCENATELFRQWADDPAMVCRFAAVLEGRPRSGSSGAVPELLKRILRGEM